MSRLLSVALTVPQVVARQKTVTRRFGWQHIKPGDRLTLVQKVMGRRPGEPLAKLAEVEVIDVRREALSAITSLDVWREGFHLIEPGGTADMFVVWFAAACGCDQDVEVTRIEWRYLDEGCP
jgi:hypothetical protein